MKSKILFATFAAFVLFVVFAFQTPLPASADGILIVQCPPIGVPMPGVTVPPPARLPFEVEPPLTPAIAPNIQTAVARTPVPMPPIVPPIRRDCSTYLAVKNHNVTVTIDNQIAKTHVDETFVNDSVYALEGTYIFPLPEDATISDFAMWVDGKKLEGQVLDKNQARRIYEDIVRTQRDPALLEYVGRNAFQARIFPIAPNTEKRVEIEYAQVLKAEQGLVRYVYPLNTEKFSPKPLANVSVNVSLKSNAALKAIYSPSHNVSVVRTGDYAAKIGYEDKNVRPDQDFVLYYSVTQDDIGLNLLSFKQGNDDGFFLMLVAPKVAVVQSQVIAKDVILVLDTSGSMQGAKIDQAKRALSYVLDQLNPQDRFNIITFSTGVNAYATSLRPASDKERARNFVSGIKAEGSTDINRALLEAMSNVDKERPTIIIFLTDGLPTTGETNVQRIITNVTNVAPKNIRLFAFGVGDDVNTTLLDSLSEKLRGATGYVRPNERIDEIVSAFYAKVSTPVLSDISVDWGGIAVNDVYPYPLPDLFAGTQLVVAGRYRNGGPTTITLKGTVNGAPQTFKYSDVTFNPSGGDAFIPRLWATRKIGYLLSEIRLRGENREIVNEIVTLAVRYGIVTPYTSFLVDERSDVLTEKGRSSAASSMAPAMAPGLSTGAGAVDQSQYQNQMKSSAAPMAAPTKAPAAVPPGASAPVTTYQESLALQYVGDKTFISRNGVWTDTQFDPSKMTTTKIEFGSDAYFGVVANNPALAKYLGLGTRLIVVVGGTAYEITNNNTGATAPNAVPTVMPAQPTPVSPSQSQSQSRASATSSSASSAAPSSPASSFCGGGFAGVMLLGGVALIGMMRRR